MLGWRRTTSRQAALITALRSEIMSLPEIDASTDSEAEAIWLNNRKELRVQILKDDPREFLTWDVVTGSMFVGDRLFVDSELDYLMKRQNWKTVWEQVIQEDPVGTPKRYNRDKRSSGNRIHTAYHLARFEEQTGLSLRESRFIVEFGGGYGSLCRLIHKLGFTGLYVIYDLPELVALQKFYLRSLSMPFIGVNDKPDRTGQHGGIFCTSDINLLRRMESHAAGGPLFIATWSLSETKPSFREEIISIPMVRSARAYLIAYQKYFEGIDNMDFFLRWCAQRPDVGWCDSEIAHMPGNHYLFGTARTP
ncbi:MAG: hypothetical protein LLG93_00600 [Deltaproteobacteria bacterium]|nr:hypothetical protein [Deltaproteobacteria bacterium]